MHSMYSFSEIITSCMRLRLRKTYEKVKVDYIDV